MENSSSQSKDKKKEILNISHRNYLRFKGSVISHKILLGYIRFIKLVYYVGVTATTVS